MYKTTRILQMCSLSGVRLSTYVKPNNINLNNPNYKMFRKQELDYYKLQKIADKKGVRQIDISYIPKKK